MTTTITWKVTTLKRELETGYVYSSDFSLTGTNDSHTHSITSTVNFKRPENLVSYTDLSETLVLKWIRDALDAANSEDSRGNPTPTDLENQVKEIIQEKVTPTIGEGVPWS